MKKILISACLLGINCRYNGREKADDKVLGFLKESLLPDSEIVLVPVCPEQLGGLPTPRIPSEIHNGLVMNREGDDVTEYFQRGANETARIAALYECKYALLKERSPSCGCGEIYDGTFSGQIIPGDGVTASLLKKQGISVFGESSLEELRDVLY